MIQKNIILIDASPKVSNSSVSGFLASKLAEGMQSEEFAITNINVRNSLAKNTTMDDFEMMIKADVLVIAFPLYIFCLPGILMRFLQDYYEYWLEYKTAANSNKQVYSIINCGFPEPEINEDAARVIKSFSEKTGSSYRFSLLIGGGGMLLETQDAPFMKKTFEQINAAFQLMISDITINGHERLENKSVEVNFPRKLYFFMGDRGWILSAKNNSLKKKDLFRKPYLEP